jgi:LPXTG-site transpeptidase (sortase) family protein
MRALVSALGTGLILVSVAGMALLASGPVGDSSVETKDEPMAARATPAPAVSETATLASSELVVAAPVPSVTALLDEDFADNRMSWPDNSGSTAWRAPGGYRLAPREPNRFVAIGAPVNLPLRDVVMTARFRKVGGPPGGGYGLIVRDQDPGLRDGIRQDGRYYVLEVGDQGEVGVWRRERDQWVELLPWTPSNAVQRSDAPNDVEVWATGSRMTLLVNGVQVASQLDDALPAGGVGVFVGGDGNDVSLERLVVRAPDEAIGAHSFGGAPAAPRAPAAAPTPTPAAFLPITRVVIPSVSIDRDAVRAELIEKNGSVTWEVPAFKIGHAQNTASAGGPGNAVLVGHVSSQNLGNVFEDLHAVRVGDEVLVFSGERRFIYRVVDVRAVARDDVAVVRSTDEASVTLITCTGLWLPVVSDYAERLVVRAELLSGNRP